MQQTTWPSRLFNHYWQAVRIWRDIDFEVKFATLQFVLPTGSHSYLSVPKKRFSGYTACLLMTCVSASLSASLCAALGVALLCDMIESVRPPRVFCGSKSFNTECEGRHTHWCTTHTKIRVKYTPFWPFCVHTDSTHSRPTPSNWEIAVLQHIGSRRYLRRDRSDEHLFHIHSSVIPPLPFSSPSLTFISPLTLHEIPLISASPKATCEVSMSM